MIINAIRQLSEAKQKTTRYVGGTQEVRHKSHLSMYNKVVQAYCTKKGEMYGKPNE